ncbi:glycoside hydrolase family 61 protein [Lineolata rhizophorae]|uniref:AA9 family lytic polysaccharide monooxygenase n=1 Tax=Lineolata rhizophorae TaxID=578093 RepID=A0A6A6P9N2_9PEZI|nr:glycoside hydrolase family 61 protein [Lineolata rhizophorae]
MKAFGFAALLATATTVSAHATWQEMWVGSTDMEGSCVRQVQNNNPVTNVDSNDIVCNVLANKSPPYGAEGVCEVEAGGDLTVEMHQQPGDRNCNNEAIGGQHYGPVMVYMCKVDDATVDDGTGCSWFKVAEDSFSGTTESWGTEILNANCGKKAFTVPADLAAGDYLVRSEAIALHTAQSSGGAQFYMSCFQVRVTGGGSANPTGVKFPGAYSASDPGILVNIHSQGFNSYEAPGPEVWTG